MGTGFSYPETKDEVLTGIDSVTNEFVNFMDSFLKLHTEYKAPRKLVLMGEDFAGRFIPRFAKALDDYTEKGGAVNVQGVAIGNPF